MRNKYLILANVCFGSMLSTYVTSCINIALPNIMQSLNFNLDSIVWVSLGYVLPYGSILPLTGILGDQFGARKMYILGLMVFTTATIFCGLSPNSTMLIGFRILQGIGAAMLLPNAMSIVATTFTAGDRSKALGLWSAASALGTAAGPTIGGYIIDFFSWRAIFFSIIPLALTNIIISYFVLPSYGKGQKVNIDYLGTLLLLTGVSCLLLVLNQGQKEGWTSLYIVTLFFIATATLTLFPLVEMYVKHPIVDMSLFRNRNFVIANIVGFISILVMYSGVFLLPFFLKTILGYDSIKAGLTMLPMSIAMLLSSPIGGWMVSRFGTRLPATCGILMIATALLLFRTIDPAYSPLHFHARLLLFGTGLGFTMSPLTNCVVESVSREQIGVASGVLNLFRIIGGGVGVVVASTLLTSRTIYHSTILTEYLQPNYKDSGDLVPLLHILWTKHGSDMSTLSTALQGVFTGHGFSTTQYSQFKLILANVIHRQSAILSFQDIFLLMAALCFSSVFLIIFIRSGKQPTV